MLDRVCLLYTIMTKIILCSTADCLLEDLESAISPLRAGSWTWFSGSPPRVGQVAVTWVSNPWFQVALGVKFQTLFYLRNMWQRFSNNKNRLDFVAAEWLGKLLYRGITGHEGFDTGPESKCPRSGSIISFVRALNWWDLEGIITFVKCGLYPGTVTFII